MKKFAVAYISFFENDVIIDFVEAEDWKSAIFKHKKFTEVEDPNMQEWIDNMPNDLEELKTEFFNGEIGVDVKEIV